MTAKLPTSLPLGRTTDVINAQDGNDFLRGLSGSDILRDGLGADTFGGRWSRPTYRGPYNDLIYGNN
ncbi:hypothetical protein KBZ08_02460 [Cyanobium sp. Candia 9D4]|uniref:hypothetical protein n=1 Tax=Cyanobium sp. Candia 9D4 TaxID=2823707 RepID=UPI0037C08DD7|nr:hypothetical protein [Cyanobium sp. Candia 9D4]